MIKTKKGSYFFVLDAFIASMIIVSALSFFINVFAVHEDPYQNLLLADDFMSFLEKTTISSYSSQLIQDFKNKGYIIDDSKTLLEQVVILYSEGSPESLGNASLLLKDISGLAPENSGINFIINNGSTSYSLYNSSLDGDPKLKLSANRIVSLFDKGSMKGPYLFEVQLWR